MNNLHVAFLLLMSIVPFSFSLVIDVCFGRPADDEPDIKAIFFVYPLWLAKRRLEKYGLYKPLIDTYDISNLSKAQADDLGRSVIRMIFTEGRKYFTWEYGAGMCPVCTNIRISILFSLFAIFVFNYPWYSVILIPCFSNLYLLIYQKLKQNGH